MCAQWIIRDDNITQIIVQLNRAKRVSKGKVRYDGQRFMFLDAIVANALHPEPRIVDAERLRIAREALFSEKFATSPIGKRSLLAEITRREKNYLIRSPQEYVLITNISSRPLPSLRRRSLQKCTLIFSPAILPKLANLRNESLPDSLKNLELPRYNHFLRLHLKARTPQEAIHRGIDTIDYLRSLWCFSINYQRYRFPGGDPGPFNDLILGPVHSLHDSNGKLKGLWSPHMYKAPSGDYHVLRNWKRALAFERWARKRIEKCSDPDWVILQFKRYVTALDSYDYDSVFLHLWSLLESLTGTKPNEPHTVTVRRAAFPFTDNEFDMSILNTLRSARNRLVHRRESPADSESLVFQTKAYVEELLRIYLDLCMRWDVSEIPELLDKPRNLNILKKEIRQLRMVQKWLTLNRR